MIKTNRVLPAFLLVLRFALFLLFQAVLALVFLLLGNDKPWHTSEGWWMHTVFFANIVCFILLVGLFRREGSAFFTVFRFTREGWWKDLLITLGFFALSAPISMFPGMWLGKLLFGASDATNTMIFRQLPLWAAAGAFLFPLTQPFAELPLYFGYIMPRLPRPDKKGWSAWAVSSLFLAFQHIAIPFIPDWRFILWRFGMFLPFAFFIGACIKLRPRLFPYMMIGHGLIDMAVVVTLFTML